MKRSRFTETQVVKILKQHEAGIPIRISASNMASVRPPSKTGRANTGGMDVSQLK